MNQVTESILINPRIEPTKLYGFNWQERYIIAKDPKNRYLIINS